MVGESQPIREGRPAGRDPSGLCPVPVSSRTPAVLIVQEGPGDLTHAAEILAGVGYRVSCCAGLEEAPDLAAREEAEVVILSARLPGPAASAFCRTLRARPELALTSILVVGPVPDRLRWLELLRAGAEDHLLTPLDPALLRARVEALGARREAFQRRLEGELAQVRREAERAQRAFFREVLAAVTGGRLELLDERELEDMLEERLHGGLELELEGSGSVARARRAAAALAGPAEGAEEWLEDLVLCVSEAATNVIKHAGGGRMRGGLHEGRVWLLFEDRGPGIHPRSLPRAALMKGFSTQPSLGYGFTILLELLDRVHLSTGPHGTRLLLEKALPGQGSACCVRANALGAGEG